MSIPDWNFQGVISPIDPIEPVSKNRSPYTANLTDFILRFSTSEERCNILLGWIKFRSTLHSLGISRGFQWLDGSFLENIEMLEGRPPGDIDCVTFYHLPTGTSQRDVFNQNPDLFNSQIAKRDFCVDAYFTHLGSPPESLVTRSSYWYSLMSHRRDSTWKGFVQIDLDPVDDTIGEAYLNSQNWKDQS